MFVGIRETEGYNPIPVDQLEYFSGYMKRGSVSTEVLQNAWRFKHEYPTRPYLALQGRQLELPPEVDQGLVLVDTLCADADHTLDLSTLDLSQLPDSVSHETRVQISEALACLRMSQVLEEQRSEIQAAGLDPEQLGQKIYERGKAWYLGQRA